LKQIRDSGAISNWNQSDRELTMKRQNRFVAVGFENRLTCYGETDGLLGVGHIRGAAQ
jgi:hypothetical protein